MHNPAHAAAVAEIEAITADYCKSAAERSSVDVPLLPLTIGASPVERGAGMMMLADARRHVANAYHIANVPIEIRNVAEQTRWAQMPYERRITALRFYFNLTEEW